MGLRFPNPVGLAAGLDKDAECLDGFGALGFGFIEVGTMTPRAQPGNPPPRLFRIREREAIVNRMGFNNHGLAEGLARVRGRRYSGVVGVNLGKNADTPIDRAADDYLAGLRAAYTTADYVVVNISSPNTQGLRDLQDEEACHRLLTRLTAERAALRDEHGKTTPLAVKVSPDLTDQHAARLAAVFRETEVDGVIATNTTLSRHGVEGLPHADERGGLSGAPLARRSTELVALLADALDGAVPVIGAGGVMTARDALDKFDAGAALVQVYTGLVYRGPALVQEILDALAERGNTPPQARS
jgi:dihydroorotate dehydrogenase